MFKLLFISMCFFVELCVCDVILFTVCYWDVFSFFPSFSQKLCCALLCVEGLVRSGHMKSDGK